MTFRNLSPFTSRRVKFIDALSKVLKELDSPDGYSTDETYEFRVEAMKCFGAIPKIRFLPHGRDCWWKAEVMRRGGLVNDASQKKAEALRKKVGFQAARDHESRVLARQFESEWNKLMHQLTKATKALSIVNYELCKPGQRLAEPVKIIQQTAMQEMKSKKRGDPTGDRNQRHRCEEQPED